jgi:K+-transporting ATPase ATPase C chain
MLRQLGPAIRITTFFTVLTGLVYPGIVAGLTQMLFPHRANGSLIEVNGQVVGSSLIGQNFTKPEYFQPRPSAAGNGYDATASGGSNYGPTNQKLIDRVKASIETFRKDNPDYTGPIPADIVTTSASGLDPDISPESAEAQAPRVAKARGVPLEKVQQLVAQRTEGRTFGFLGEPRVNVLELNLALDRQFLMKSAAKPIASASTRTRQCHLCLDPSPASATARQSSIRRIVDLQKGAPSTRLGSHARLNPKV